MRQHTIASVLVGLLLALGLAGTAQAQTTAGGIAGEAKAGDKVVINCPDSGFHRELDIEADGKFSVRHVPMGACTVVRMNADGTVASSSSVVVKGGRTVRVM